MPLEYSIATQVLLNRPTFGLCYEAEMHLAIQISQYLCQWRMHIISRGGVVNAMGLHSNYFLRGTVNTAVRYKPARFA